MIRVAASCLLALILPASSLAQTEPYGRVVDVDGRVSLFPAGSGQRLLPTPNYPIGPGVQVQSGNGRIEIDFGPGATLWIAPNSEVRIGTDTEPREIAIKKGRVALETWSDERGGLRLATQFGDIAPQTRSMLEIALVNDTAILDIDSGVVEVTAAGTALLAPAPGRMVLRHGAPHLAAAAEERLRDDFEAWIVTRHEKRRLDQPSSLWDSYARELMAAGEFRSCAWGDLCWIPALTDFVPGKNGQWLDVKDGRFWIPAEAWGWAPSHYGQWRHDERGWVWLPDDRFRIAPITDGKEIPRSASRHPLAASIHGVEASP